MEEIVISKTQLLNLINKTTSYAQLAVEIQILSNVSPSITDLQRQAFEAGRSAKMGTDLDFEFTYPSFNDYQNREK